MHELVHNDRVIGGVDKASTQKALRFISNYVKGELHATNARTAEMCKLVENSSRDVQIAFANELSLICDKAGINVWELITLGQQTPKSKYITTRLWGRWTLYSCRSLILSSQITLWNLKLLVQQER